MNPCAFGNESIHPVKGLSCLLLSDVCQKHLEVEPSVLLQYHSLVFVDVASLDFQKLYKVSGCLVRY